MNRKHWYFAAVIGATIATLVGGGYSRHVSRDADQDGGTGFARAYTRSEGKGGFHMLGSADEVSMTARLISKSGPGQNPVVQVRLIIKKGWHVNANPASLRFLIPTTVKATINHKNSKLDISYPPGRDSHIKLDGKSIFVYDDNTILNAGIPPSTLTKVRSAGAFGLAVTVQSCSTKGICLPPARLRSTISAQL